jgi:hypothetical protein
MTIYRKIKWHHLQRFGALFRDFMLYWPLDAHSPTKSNVTVVEFTTPLSSINNGEDS